MVVCNLARQVQLSSKGLIDTCDFSRGLMDIFIISMGLVEISEFAAMQAGGCLFVCWPCWQQHSWKPGG